MKRRLRHRYGRAKYTGGEVHVMGAYEARKVSDGRWQLTWHGQVLGLYATPAKAMAAARRSERISKSQSELANAAWSRLDWLGRKKIP